jgi:hypothetical protein
MSRDTRRDGKHVKNHVWTGTGTADRLISEQRQINSAQLSSFHVRIGRPFCCWDARRAGARSGDVWMLSWGRVEARDRGDGS